jgi:hypothetical protein
MKLTFVITKHNPSVSVFDEADMHQTEEKGIKLDEINFMTAFVITDSATG